MKPAHLLTALLICSPAATAAQTPPTPVPPASPAPPALPALPPLPPTIDPFALEDAVRASRDAMRSVDVDVQALEEEALRNIDVDAIREQAERMQQDAERQARDLEQQAREMARQSADGRNFVFQMRNPAGPFNAIRGEEGQYNSGLSALQRRQYDQAITQFDQVIGQKGAHADGALYWKAYAQYKLRRTSDALATIAELRQQHAQSRYLSDARVLEADARKASGQPLDANAATTTRSSCSRSRASRTRIRKAPCRSWTACSRPPTPCRSRSARCSCWGRTISRPRTSCS